MATQLVSLLAWRALPPSEIAQRSGSVAVQAAFLALPCLLPALYLRWRRCVLVGQRIQFFLWPLLRQPRGGWPDGLVWFPSCALAGAYLLLCAGCLLQHHTQLHPGAARLPTAGIQSALNTEPSRGPRGVVFDLLRCIWVRDSVRLGRHSNAAGGFAPLAVFLFGHMPEAGTPARSVARGKHMSHAHTQPAPARCRHALSPAAPAAALPCRARAWWQSPLLRWCTPCRCWGWRRTPCCSCMPY